MAVCFTPSSNYILAAIKQFFVWCLIEIEFTNNVRTVAHKMYYFHYRTTGGGRGGAVSGVLQTAISQYEKWVKTNWLMFITWGVHGHLLLAVAAGKLESDTRIGWRNYFQHRGKN